MVGGGCILVIPEVREGGVKYGSRLWYGVGIF